MKQIKARYQRELDKSCKDEVQGEDMTKDHTNIEWLMKLKYILKIFRLVITIAFVSFYIGLSMIMMFQIVDDNIDREKYETFFDEYIYG